MKKLLLFFALAAMSTTMYAQSLDLMNEGNGQLLMPVQIAHDVEAVIVDDDNDAEEVSLSSQRRSYRDGLYYIRPTGMMYHRYYSDTGLVHGSSEYEYPFFKEHTYENYSTNTAGTHWVHKDNATDTTGTLLETDSEMYYTTMLLPNEDRAQYTTPYLYSADYSEHWTMAFWDDTNLTSLDSTPDIYTHYVYGSGKDNAPAWLGWADTKRVMYFYYVSNNSSNICLDTFYALGSGKTNEYTSWTVYDKGHKGEDDYKHTKVTASWVCDTVRCICLAPASPLYVYDVYVNGLTFAYGEPEGTVEDLTFQPLKNGAELKLLICECGKEGSGTEAVLDTLTATTGDWTGWAVNDVSSDGYPYTNSRYQTGCLRFTKKDENGNAVPFVIDGRRVAKIAGFANEDIDLGISSDFYAYWDKSWNNSGSKMYNVRNCYIDPEGEYEIYTSPQFGSYTMSINFNGMMDAVDVDEKYSNLLISSDGKYCANAGISYADDLKGFLIQTALPWTADDGTENYSLADAPDWITGITVTPYGSDVNTYVVSLQAAANTGDTRSAVVHVQCKGYADSANITITQYDTSSDGINEVAAPTATKKGATYNLAGQKVGENAKGVVIKDGKKILAK